MAALSSLGYGGKDFSDPMDAGSVFHDGLEMHYKGGNREQSINTFTESYYQYFPTDSRVAEKDNYS